MNFASTVSTCVFLLGFAAASAAADIALWTFDERSGTGLSNTSNQISNVSFDGGATGVSTNGEGALRIRRPLGTSIVRNVPIEPITSGRVWLELDLKGWDLYDEPNEELSFGFYQSPGMEDVAALLQWQRLTPEKVWIQGLAEGAGSTDAPSDTFFPRKQEEGVRLVLECDLDRYTYEIFLQKTPGKWVTLARGAISEDAEIHYFGIRFSNHFSGPDEEFLDIDRIAITRQDPIDRDLWTPLAETPFVTAWTWAVADGATGEIIAGHKIDTPRKSASITKAMTTYVICELAARDPSVLQERVVFSELALRATGSSANIEAGESITVHDALYALMLPSGNAVGNALAEHFQDRFAPPEDAEPGAELSPRANFIAEMNRAAARLGMENTIYRSAFGDGGGSAGRTTTARDLITLAHAAQQNDIFRQIVSTYEYSAEVTRADGLTRTASWTNTNQFLAEGDSFDGIKTGTTGQARACLLSSATLNGRSLYAVVLGSNHRQRRYVDSRNLLEWASVQELRTTGF